MASITQGHSTTPMTLPTTKTRPRVNFTALNLRIGFLRSIALTNGVILLLLLLALVIVDLPLGVLAPLWADLIISHPQTDPLILRATLIGVIGFVVFVDISQSLRRLPPSYAALYSLSGQAILLMITAVYVLMGRLPPLALYGVGGTFILSCVGIVGVVQSFTYHPRFAIRGLLYPVLSLLLGGLGLGLIVSPDTATRQLIDTRYGTMVLVTLLGILAWGCGQLRQNHLTPDKMVRRLTGIILYPVFSLRALFSGEPVSLLGVFLALNVAAMAVFLAFVQAEIERVDAERIEAERKALSEGVAHA